MSHFNIILGLAVAAGLSACSASSQQSAEAEAVSKSTAPMATVKPGANVSMTSALPKAMTSGTYQTVQLRFDEAYDQGAMTVTVAPSAGLSLFGSAGSKTFDLAASGTQVWDLDVKADVDGVYFLNVFAEAQGQARAFSVRLNIGTTTQKMFDAAMPPGGELADGGKIRVMDAEETIE